MSETPEEFVLRSLKGTEGFDFNGARDVLMSVKVARAASDLVTAADELRIQLYQISQIHPTSNTVDTCSALVENVADAIGGLASAIEEMRKKAPKEAPVFPDLSKLPQDFSVENDDDKDGVPGASGGVGEHAQSEDGARPPNSTERTGQHSPDNDVNHSGGAGESRC